MYLFNPLYKKWVFGNLLFEGGADGGGGGFIEKTNHPVFILFVLFPLQEGGFCNFSYFVLFLLCSLFYKASYILYFVFCLLYSLYIISPIWIFLKYTPLLPLKIFSQKCGKKQDVTNHTNLALVRHFICLSLHQMSREFSIQGML
jgi:hypothetical protein